MDGIRWVPEGASTGVPVGTGIYTFLLKIASRCNLNCDYCYVYQGPDQSWRRRPKFMSEDIADQTFKRIAEHVAETGISEVAITFHGGEPLLAGINRIKHYIESAKRTIPVRIDFGIQTNGTLLNQSFLDLFSEHRVLIGLSVDGSKRQNDTHRPFHNGKSSYKRVIQAINLVEQRADWRSLLTGYLAVIDLDHSPAELFDAIASFGGRGFNILLPDCNHQIPPVRPDTDTDKIAYGKWMVDLFEHWMQTQSKLEIRYFEEIIAMLFGLDSTSEAIGAKQVDLIVVESDGEIESVDSLKMVSEEATTLGLNVFSNGFSDALGQPQVASRLMGYDALCEQCRNCDLLNQCGGGYIPHRYSAENGFLNPSVYCKDIQYLIRHIRQSLGRELKGARC